MSYFRACRWLAFVAILHGAAAIACAQPPVSEVEQAPTPPISATKSPPDLYYLPDANGKLVPVPGFRWEEFAELLAIQRREATTARPPHVVFDEVHIEGAAGNDRATLTVSIQATINETGWLPMPLRFDQCVLQEHSSEGAEMRIEPAPDGLGLLAWFRAERAGPMRCELKLLKSLEGAGAAGELTLNLPRAAKTDVALRVATPEVSAEIGEDEGLVATNTDGQGGALISVQAVAGRLHLRWTGSSQALAAAPTLEATGALTVQLDADGVATAAKLMLRSTSLPLETVQVRLPMGATLLPERQASYTVELLSPATDGEAGVAQIRLHEPNTVAEVRIQTRQEWPASQEPIELGGFAVSGAARQRGYVALQVSDELHAQLEERLLVRQVDELPTGLREARPWAGFEYTGQPFSLLASVSPRITRVAIDPQYQVSVTPDAMLLRARLKCRVRDGSLQRLKIDLQDWVVDDESWGPAGLVADNSLIGARLQPLIVPFQRPLTGEFELHFEARRSIASDGKQVEFALPRPEGTLVGQAQLVVTAADNVRLAPAAESQMKLIAQRPDASVNLPALRQPPHFFLGDVAEARFAAGFEVRDREVHAKVQAQATLQGSRVAVRQRLRYQIENEGLDRVRLRIPRAILAAGNLRLTLLDAEPVPLAVASLENSTDEPTTVFLPRKYLGELELEARFDLPIAEGAKAWELPLIQPAEVVDDGAELELVTPAGLEPKLAGADWVFENRGSDAASDRWTTAKSPRQIAIELRRSENRAPNEDLVERAWVQSQLVGNRRQDRVVWRVVAPDGELQVQLPEGVRARDVLILLDGAPISAAQTPDGLLRLTWPANQGAAHSVELDYRLDDLAGDRVRELPPARLAAAGRMKQVYWELLLPAQEHLIGVSAAYQLEYAWTWQGGYWARTPARSNSELRAWSGASERDALPTNSNRYVLSTFGDLAPLDARVGARSALLLTSSTVLLAAGLLSMFAPAWLRSGSQFALSVGVVVLLALAGDLGPLLLQSAAPGVACLAMAWGVHGWQHRRRGHQPLLQGSTHARHVSSLAERSTGVASASSHTSRRIAVQAVPSDLS